uniref:Uncharacterized protein n=1 Tax=Opuntia streptacantha TaxID=393608 RepID=A0A7C9DW47_OPUST
MKRPPDPYSPLLTCFQFSSSPNILLLTDFFSTPYYGRFLSLFHPRFGSFLWLCRPDVCLDMIAVSVRCFRFSAPCVLPYGSGSVPYPGFYGDRLDFDVHAFWATVEPSSDPEDHAVRGQGECSFYDFLNFLSYFLLPSHNLCLTFSRSIPLWEYCDNVPNALLLAPSPEDFSRGDDFLIAIFSSSLLGLSFQRSEKGFENIFAGFAP